MVLEKLSNKVNSKKNIYKLNWKLETDKIIKQNLGAWRQGVERRGEGEDCGELEGMG